MDDKTKELLDFIGKVESGKGYNVKYGGGKIPLDTMTLREVLDFQEDWKKKGTASTAVGRYQFIHKTLKSIVDRNPNDFPLDRKFDAAAQDEAATILLKRRGYGELPPRAMALELSKEWASMPDPRTGKSYYAGDGLNKSLVPVDDLLQLLGK